MTLELAKHLLSDKDSEERWAAAPKYEREYYTDKALFVIDTYEGFFTQYIYEDSDKD